MWQIRASTRTTRYRTHEQITFTYIAILISIAMNKEALSAGAGSSDTELAKSADGQKMFYFATFLGFVNQSGLMRMQRTRCVMEEETGNAKFYRFSRRLRRSPIPPLSETTAKRYVLLLINHKMNPPAFLRKIQ